MTREFEELALDGHNYHTWALDVKISLALRGMYETLVPPAERIVPLLEPFKYSALYIIKNHFHPDPKSVCDVRRTKYTLDYSSNLL
jgi:hypothetical protein